MIEKHLLHNFTMCAKFAHYAQFSPKCRVGQLPKFKVGQLLSDSRNAHLVSRPTPRKALRARSAQGRHFSLFQGGQNVEQLHRGGGGAKYEKYKIL